MERRYDIDWIRIIAILLILFFHSAMLFIEEWEWHIQNAERSYLFLEFNFWLSRFRMPLLFFVSGFGSYLALRKRTGWRYLFERHQRLMIPLLAAMLIVIPPQVYMERIYKGIQYDSYLDFYLTIFELIPYPEGNTTWHHMWFVLYLFTYSVAGLPLFLYIRSNHGKRLLDWLMGRTNRIHSLMLMTPTILLAVFLTYRQPDFKNFISDWAWHPYWFSFFFMGYLTGAVPSIWKTIEKNRRTYLGLSLAAILLINTVRWNDIHLTGIIHYTYLAILATNGWLWLLTAIGYGKRYLNKSSPMLDYANRAIYPFYILHQTVIIIIGYYVIQVEESILSKYLFVCFVSFVGTLGIYEFLVRPYRITRLLFGVKELPHQENNASKELPKPEELLSV